MIKSLATCLLLAITALPQRGGGPERHGAAPPPISRAGLDGAPASADPAADQACTGVSVSRGLKYGESERNVLDVATSPEKPAVPRPVLLFVAGQSFADGAAQAEGTLRDRAMCLAAKTGMVGVTMSYRLAPANPWPAGAQDVAAATSWIHQNIDLYGGDAQAIVAIGYSVGAFHLASFLAHREFQDTDSSIAGAVLLSGIYRAGGDTADGERSYFGADASKYDERSAFPGILAVESPIVLAWSTADPPRLITQGETMKARLCGAGHCPRTALLTDRDSPASVFGVDGAGDGLADRTNQLLSQIAARGLP